MINTNTDAWGVITEVGENIIAAPLRGGRSRGVSTAYGPNEWAPNDRFRIPEWERLTVAIDNEDDDSGLQLDANVLFSIAENTLTFQSSEPATDPVAAIRIRFTHNYVGGRLEPSPTGSDEKYNRVFARRVVVSDVNSAAGMERKLNWLHEQYNYPLEVITCIITDDEFPSDNMNRFESGQWVNFTNRNLYREGLGADGASIGTNKSYLIHKVTTKVLGGTLIEYELELRDWEVDLI